MKRAVLLGVAVGFAAIALGWHSRPGRSSVQPGSVAPLASPPRREAAGEAGAAVPAGSAGRIDTDLEALRARALLVPVDGLRPEDLRDSFHDPRTGHRHEALDILAPRGRRVLAAEDGTIARLVRSGRGGLTVYELDPSARYCYYYAHLARYAFGLHHGQVVRRGEALGLVGTTGNAAPRTPHLHFAVYRLGPGESCPAGTPINPFRIWVH